MSLPDGGKYVGKFKNGLAHGQGTLTSPKATRMEMALLSLLMAGNGWGNSEMGSSSGEFPFPAKIHKNFLPLLVLLIKGAFFAPQMRCNHTGTDVATHDFYISPSNRVLNKSTLY